MLATLMALALGASPGPWGELQIAGSGSYGTGIGLEEYTGAAALAVSGFLHHRLIEDDVPLSLQPYLQRAGAIEALSWWMTPSVRLGLEYRSSIRSWWASPSPA